MWSVLTSTMGYVVVGAVSLLLWWEFFGRGPVSIRRRLIRSILVVALPFVVWAMGFVLGHWAARAGTGVPAPHARRAGGGAAAALDQAADALGTGSDFITHLIVTGQLDHTDREGQLGIPRRRSSPTPSRSRPPPRSRKPLRS